MRANGQMARVCAAACAGVALTVSAEALVISEVCARCQPKAVPACKDLGWIEFYNGTDAAVNLKDYKLLVLNRGKKIDAAKNILALADCEIAPGAYALVYTSEEFGNKKVAAVEDTFAGRGTITVYPKKINQKKYPYVQLFKAGEEGDELVQTVVVPVDLADEASYTTVPERKILATATPGAANVYGDGDVAYGPNISSLYGVKDAPDPWQAFPKAEVGQDYAVSFPVNPADMSEAEDDAIASVQLIYQIDFGGEVAGPVMTKAEAMDKLNGWVYTGAIPGTAFTKPGQLVRFAARITDGLGRTWRSPSFCNPDDGYEWYGTIVTPGTAAGEGAESAKLQTFHLFADPDEVADTPGVMNKTALMNLDADDEGYTTERHPHGARIGVYDSTTGLYYDHVRIDLRGHTSAGYVKKSHGLKFNKSQPLSCTDPVTGTVVEEIRKSSFISEFPDVSGIRQMFAFKIFNDNGSPAPFDYPVRLNLNGAFYQLAYHSERFTDELVEDCYGLDPLGYSYKNVGTFAAGNVLKIEKKTPDDDHEEDLSVLNGFIATLQKVKGTSGTTTFPADAPKYPEASKVVVRSFDLPAWLNYIALERITGERDGLCANTSAFYDVNGTDTWRPLAYDMNMSFGVYNTGLWGEKVKDESLWSKQATGLAPTHENLHPLSGGLHIGDDANWAVENIFQSAKFRRLYLRRLRTLMDKVLKAPGTALADTPAFQWAKDVADRIADDAAIDRALWMTDEYIPTGAANWVWGDRRTAWTVAEGWDDLWDNYVVPRREYLFNMQVATKGTGYGKTYKAGIPAAQRPTSELKAGFSFDNVGPGCEFYDADALVIRNDNDEAVDMSGWTLTGKVAWTLPEGTVIDAHDTLTVVADRKAYVAAHEGELASEPVIVGNAAIDAAAVAPLVLTDADGVEVVSVAQPPERTVKPMANAAWGYVVDGLVGADGVERAYVFTNTTAAMTWKAPADVTSVELLVVAGGGAGGDAEYVVGGGGGGAGGYLHQVAYAVAAKQSYSVEVGVGGAGTRNAGDSSFGEVVAKGGGHGGARSAGQNGGSGGGGSGCSAKGVSRAAGKGTGGQGFDGGVGLVWWDGHESAGTGGGGGGASAAGGNAKSDDYAGMGGEGETCTITGLAEVYCSGGGGGSSGATRTDDDGCDWGLGGRGAGDGGDGANRQGGDATGYGCGGGAAGHWDDVKTFGGAGFQGVVIVRCLATEEPSAWTEPTADTPEAIGAALAADGFGPTARGAFANLEAYAAFKAYCETKLGMVDPKVEARSGAKANALLGYALGAETVPETAVVSDDVTITALAYGDGTVALNVSVAGFEPNDAASVAAALAAVVSATGGESLTDMTPEQVAVEAREVKDGVLTVTVAPVQVSADAFFVRAVILN